MAYKMNKEQRIKGGIYGLLIGDAVGVPYEFHSAENLPRYDFIDMIPPSNFDRTYPDIKVGTWSDDGAQALCLLASLLETHQLDLNDLMHRFSNWYQHGYMAVGGKVFDVGIQTANAIRLYLQGISVMHVASNDELANGNGALMRVLPLAIWHQGKDQDLVEAAYLQSHVTHAHLRSKVCCAIYCLWARYILQGQAINAAWERSIDYLRNLYQRNSDELEQLEFFIRPEDLGNCRGSGYVVDCLKSAYLALQEKDYQSTIQRAIAFGNDTDTTACVAGGIAGLYYGFNHIPKCWVNLLREKNIADDLIEKLVQYLS